MDTNKNLIVAGASENNLKNIDVIIPHNSFTVITGVSGSGKSSLAYNVIFKESQRRFLESFSSYSRQYLGKLEKPKVREITGLQAALAINQKTAVANPRSTVGTMSGIYDYLRLLYARLGVVHCTACANIIKNTDLNICSKCNNEHPELLTKLFSFNSKYGACEVCNGLGVNEQIDKSKLIADESKTLEEGALVPTTPNGYIVYSQVRVDELNKVCMAHGFSVNIPWKELTNEQQNVIWYGSDRVKILFGKHSLESRLKWKGITAKPREEAYYKGMIPIMEEILHRDRNDNILRFANSFVCTKCSGNRIRKEAQSVTINNKNICELTKMQLSELNLYLKDLTSVIDYEDVYSNIIQHVFNRLKYLELLGLNYLTLSRESTTLSGGEAQRIRLASQVGSGLQGILYILDEPSVGLHPHDNKKLLKVLKSLRDNGNTLLVVEHDEETILAADYLIDIGPKAGINGGEVIYQGNPNYLITHKNKYPRSLTAHAISKTDNNSLDFSQRPSIGDIKIRNASKYNLKNINIFFKLGCFNVVTGVSGAGKSTLVHKVLSPLLKDNLTDNENTTLESSIKISRVIEIDQSPIGRTPRSNPATYTSLFDHIRDLFAKLPESIKRGYKKGRFSFNNKGGRCEHCQGAGYIQLGMHFLGDIVVVCEHCNGKRFNDETLEVLYLGKNIFEVLELSIDHALIFFQAEDKITKVLSLLINLDVGYLKLGQPSTTLSGGEAQRVKLASELYKTSKGHTLYILDEPTVGLHKTDISLLLKALNDIVNNGSTVIVIEHDLDIIKQSDQIIDLGPEGGENGGCVVVQGSVSDVSKCTDSYTGKALIELFNKTNIKTQIKKHSIEPSNILFEDITTNNLKNINVEIPLNKTTVITGISGSGKSSLAFDTIFSESRNRFTENLSTYARRMMSKIKKPELEQCFGLTPAIAIKQTQYKKNQRSTVGTISEIYDLYRLLFSRAGIEKDGTDTHLPASMFSFNKLQATCHSCKGLGIITTADPSKFITHPHKALTNGAMDGSLPGKFFGDINGQYVNTLVEVGKTNEIDFGVPYSQLSHKAKHIALDGTGDKKYNVEWAFKRGKRTGSHRLGTIWKGFTNYLTEECELKSKGSRGIAYLPIMSDFNCPACNGNRLKPNALEVKFANLNIGELSSKTISNAIVFFGDIKSKIRNTIFIRSEIIIGRILTKLKRLEDIGLGYIGISRQTSTLSGGEAQRLRIATQLVSDLCGLTYVLDEPTIGLHSRDTKYLLKAINTLKDNGNTVIIVEHDPDVIKFSDNIIDMGPGAGDHGGEIIAQGDLKSIINNSRSITGKYLEKERYILTSIKHIFTSAIDIAGASANNLDSFNIKIPVGVITALTGVSGSGKTSLSMDVIANSFYSGTAINCNKITFSRISSISVINQQKIGTSPTSTPATYTGMFELIRELFAKLEPSKLNKLKKSNFSFNSNDVRCPTCKGMGSIKVSMDFLSDVWTNCDTCNGKRFKDSILKIKFNGYNISDILNLEIAEAIVVFKYQSKILRILNVLNDIGLGYLKLGQATSTLSGGETQRLKLGTKLMNENDNNCLYIFDEPSTGLHMQDVEKLIFVFQKLVKNGNTVLVVEHNLNIIAASNWIIDLGPEGGDKGGRVLFEGYPQDIIKCKESFTGRALVDRRIHPTGVNNPK